MEEAVCGRGIYHHIKDSKVKILYKGNTRTCGQCYEEAYKCPGNGIARECTSGRVELGDHMERLKRKVQRLKQQRVTGTSPEGFERRPEDFVDLNKAQHKDTGQVAISACEDACKGTCTCKLRKSACGCRGACACEEKGACICEGECVCGATADLSKGTR